MDGASELLHATTISVAGRAALICGNSGAGKSDLALRCLSMAASPLNPTAARLVADDQTIVTRRASELIATAPEAIAGRLEIRGLGIVTIEHEQRATIALVVDLSSKTPASRLLDPWPGAIILGLAAPLLRLLPFEASAPAKLLAALNFPHLPAIVPAA